MDRPLIEPVLPDILALVKGPGGLATTQIEAKGLPELKSMNKREDRGREKRGGTQTAEESWRGRRTA